MDELAKLKSPQAISRNEFRKILESLALSYKNQAVVVLKHEKNVRNPMKALVSPIIIYLPNISEGWCAMW